jgi:aspartate aminotransferase-like enzyme
MTCWPKDPAITSVMLVHSETSTATRCDLEAIGKNHARPPASC